MRWLLLLFLVPFLSLGQSVYFKTITAKDGLSNNSINSIVNHSDGSVWIGTWDGLNLYDGKYIKVLKHNANNPKSIGGNYIHSLIKDAKGKLWVLTDGKKQISKYVGKGVFINYEFKSTPNILSLDKNNNVIVQLQTKEWYIYKDESFSLIDKKYIKEVTKNLEANKNKRVSAYISQVVLEKTIKKQFTDLSINTVTLGQNGDVWVGTGNAGIYLIRRVDGQYVIVANYKIDPQNQYGLLSNEITVTHSDPMGNLWIGTKDGGVSILPKLNGNIKYIYPHDAKQPNLPYETIRAIEVDHLDGKWIGYYTQGLYYQKKGSEVFVPIRINKQAENPNWNRIRSIYEDSQGYIWVGTYAGVVRIRGNEQIFFEERTTPFFTENRTYTFVEDTEDNIWVGSWGGMSKFNLLTKKFEAFINQDKLNQYHIRHITVLDNQLILSTEKHGVVFYNYRSGEINVINHTKGLLGDNVYTTYVDDFTGELWVASLGGITIFDTDNKIKKKLTEAEGLPSHLIYSLMPFKDDVWISTTKGIATISKKTFNILNYSNYVGWQGLEFSEGAYDQNKRGILLYGGNKGLNIVNPSQLNNLDKSPAFKAVFNGESVLDQKTVYFDPEDNMIRFALYPIGFNQYPINQFEYKITGLFDDWRSLPQQEIHLDDLDHKVYTLEVRDVLSKNKEIVYSVEFEVQKPFFLKPYFIVGLLGVVGLFVFWSIKRKQKEMRKREVELKKQVRERTREVESKKSDLAKKNEVLSQLNIEIKQQREELLALHSKLKDGDIEMENFRIFLLSRIKKPILNILTTLEDLNVEKAKKEELMMVYDLVREWDYIEQVNDNTENELITVNLHSFIEHLKEEWLPIKDKYGITINIINELNSDWVELDLLRFKLMLRYLVHECCKYIEDNQTIDFVFLLQDNQLNIKIQSDSKSLISFWNENRNYSPYYRVFNSLLQHLKGNIYEIMNTQFHIVLELPVVNVDQVNKERNWNEYLEELHILPKDKTNILVYAKEDNKAIVKQILGNKPDVNVVYNHNVSKVVGNIEHYKYDALILYNVSLSDRTLALFSQIKKYIEKQRLLVFYVTEEVDYYMQEQLLQLGVSDFIYLPSNKSNVENKIYKRIRYDKENKESGVVLWKKNLNEDVVANLSPNERLFRKGMDIMDKHFSDPAFGVEQLTKELGVSKMKCYRLFKEFLDQAPLEILIEMRLQKAKVMLEKEDLTISEICFECGFNDPKYFSKSFKKRFEYSPSHFRND